MIFRLIIITYFTLLNLATQNGRSQVFGYDTKTMVKSCYDNQTILCPTNELQIQALIKDAYTHGSTIIRVIGSQHSYYKAILDEGDINTKKKLMIVSLEKYQGVTIDKERGIATVKAGTHLEHSSITYM